MMCSNGYGMGWGMWLLMGVGMLAVWVLIILLIRALLPSRVQYAVESAPRPDPRTLLKETLARGEITTEEYERRRRLIVDGHS